ASCYPVYAHFGTGAPNAPPPPTNLAGADLLPIMANGSLAAGSQGFTPPLGPGDYTFLIQQQGTNTAYQIDFVGTPSTTGGPSLPIALYNASGVTDVTFALSYNPSLLAVTAGSTSDSTGTGTKSFTLVSSTTIDATHATANFHYSNTSGQSGTVVLGDIVASVPTGAASTYKAKELLELGNIKVNGAAFTGASASGLHVNAYAGDVTGNGTIDGLDVATANNVAQGKDPGFAAYPLLDPAIIGDVANDISVDAGDVSTLAAFVSHLPTPQVPVPPAGVVITPVGADPTLSLANTLASSNTMN